MAINDTPDARHRAWVAMNRRKLLVLASAAVVAAPFPATAQRAKQTSERQAKTSPTGETGPAPAAGQKFFSAHEFATLDEMAEMIVPADEVSGGARAAKVTEYIDQRMGESLDTEMRQSWRDDLAEIDRLSRNLFGKTFRAGSVAERSRLLDRISRNEAKPKEAGEYAFGTIKWQVTFAYYKTRIGIHDDLKYLGNTLLDEFLGTDVALR